VQDELLADGLRLALLPSSLCEAVREAACELDTPAPQPLSPRALCSFLKENQRRASPSQLRALRTLPLSSALLRFVLPAPDKADKGDKGEAKPPPPPPIDLAVLAGVPLLRLADGSLAEFGDGKTRFWRAAAPLLPHAPQLLLHERTALDLRAASRSLQPVDQACERQLGIRHLQVPDLLQHKDAIHALRDDETSDGGRGPTTAWLSAFWTFVSLQLEVRDPKLHAGAAHDLRSLMRLFADWSVLQVEHHADPLVVRTVALSSVGTAFNLHEIDKEWQQDVRDLLQACRVHVPCPWHVAVNMPLRTLVPVGDAALVMLLVVAMERVTFTAKLRQAALRYPNPNPNPNPDPDPGPKPDPDPNSSPSSNPDPNQTVLRYFASRKQNSPDVLSTLRKMPLFLRSMPSQSEHQLRSSGQPSTGSKFVRLDQPGMQYLTLYETQHLKLKHAGKLQLLELEGLCFVAQGGPLLKSLYEQLGVRSTDTLSFVKERLPRKLLRVLSDGDTREADKVLAELTLTRILPLSLTLP
jgi:hypothetical protein